jgi:glycosyltransferase involved in cell wall biosynthesis
MMSLRVVCRHLMRIWLIQPGEPLPCDPGIPRLLRVGLLAEELVRRGHQLTWWASTFRHSTKTHRARQDTTTGIAPGYQIILLHSPGYTSNISVRRFIDHRILGRRFRERARREAIPEVIHCALPTIELAYETARYAGEHGIPWVIDARDMWPDIYVDSVSKLLKPVARGLLRNDFRMTRAAFQHASAITGHAPGFVEWGLAYAGRRGGDLDVDFPFGYPSTAPAEAALADAHAAWDRLGISTTPEAFNVCFFGTFAARGEVDLMTVLAAAALLNQRLPSVKLIICGAGPQADSVRQGSSGLRNILLPGWIDFPQIWTLMRRCHLGLLPYLPSRDFAASIPNKAVEYLSAGLPILTSLTGGYLERLLRKSGSGRFYRGGDPESLASAIVAAANDRSGLARERDAAMRIFEKQFSFDVVTASMADHLLQVGRTVPARRNAMW